METTYKKVNNSGVLFRETEKKTEKHPDYKGNILVNGQEYWISGWTKIGKNGKFLGLAVTPKEQEIASSDLKEDDIPF
jgi:hypothetical protein